MSITKRILRNVFSNWAGYAFYIIVGFFMSPFIIHSLGDTGYGLWVLVGSLTGYMGILDFGLRPAIVKYVSRYHALADEENLNQVVNTVFVIFSAVAVVIVLASIVLATFAYKVFRVPPEYYSELRILLILVGANLALSFPFGVFGGVINALQRFDINNYIGISALAIRTAIIVVVLKSGGGLVAFAAIVLVSTLLESIVKTHWCFRIIPSLRINPFLAKVQTLRHISAFSLFTFIIGIAGRLMFQSSSIIVGAFISAAAITFYAIANNLINYMSQVVSNVSVTITPLASAFDAQHEEDRMKRLLLVGTRYCFLIILPVGFSYLIMGEPFIRLWMGIDYVPLSSTVLIILTLAQFGHLSQYPAGSIFYGTGRVKLLAFMNLIMAVVNIGLSLLLVKPYGLHGVALGTAVPLFLYGSIFHPIYICRVLRVPLTRYFLESYARPLMAAGPLVALLVFFRLTVTFQSLIMVGVAVGISILVYGGIAFFIALEPSHRAGLLNKLNELTARKSA